MVAKPVLEEATKNAEKEADDEYLALRDMFVA